MASQKLLELLNRGIAREIGVSVQYMWQHVMATGMQSPAVKDVFKKIAIAEMKHAEEIAERLHYLGGIPTTHPTPIKVGGSVKEMLEDDLQAEKEAITLYSETICQATEESDPVTRLLFEQILAEEEGHADTFMTILGTR